LGLIGLAWAVASLLVAGDPLLGLWQFAALSALALTFIAGAGLDSLDGAMRGCAAGVAVSALICVAQLCGWTGLKQMSVPAGLFYSREMLAEFAAPVLVWYLVPRSAVGVVATQGQGRRLTLRLLQTEPSRIMPLLGGFVLLACQSRVGVLAVALGALYAWRQQIRELLTPVLLAHSGCCSELPL
jgi:hypothetical protein